MSIACHCGIANENFCSVLLLQGQAKFNIPLNFQALAASARRQALVMRRGGL